MGEGHSRRGLESGYQVQIPALPPTSCSTLVKVLASVSSAAEWGNRFLTHRAVLRTTEDQAGRAPSAGLG